MKKAINKNGFRFKPYLPHEHKKLGFGQIPIEKPELDYPISPKTHLHHEDFYWLKYYQTSKIS